MTPIKRLEIVINSTELNTLIYTLKKNGIKGYTIIKNVQGNGERGEQDGDGLTPVFHNCYVLIACTEEEVQRLEDPIRMLLEESGGILLMSDALWLKH
jgi:nitrogen regulatory protein PII